MCLHCFAPVLSAMLVDSAAQLCGVAKLTDVHVREALHQDLPLSLKVRSHCQAQQLMMSSCAEAP